MLDREIEQHWEVVKESYPDAVVFHETHGLYIVKGRDVEVLAKEFGIDSSSGSRWYGFEQRQAAGYMLELAQRGYAVVRATKDAAARVEPPADRTKEIRRQRKKSTFLAVEPRLLFEEELIANATNARWMKQHAYQQLFESFEAWLSQSDQRSLRDFGELYIYQVGDWYELDLELTSMLEGHVLLLTKAAFTTGTKLPCRVVEPKCRRERAPARGPHSTPPLQERGRLGQLGFDVVATW